MIIYRSIVWYHDKKFKVWPGKLLLCHILGAILFFSQVYHPDMFELRTKRQHVRQTGRGRQPSPTQLLANPVGVNKCP